MTDKAVQVVLLGLVVLGCGACSSSQPDDLFRGAIPVRNVTPTDYEQCEVDFVLPQDPQHPAMIFCTLNYHDDENGSMSLVRPVIFRHEPDGWKAIDFNVERFAPGYTWIHVAASREKPNIWAIAHWSSEGPGPEVEIIFSGDGGKTWRHIATVPKPNWLSELTCFRMGPDGHGTLVFRRNEDEGGDIGFYRYQTSDGGKTWSKPEYEQDVLEKAAEPEQGRQQSLLETMKEIEGK
jgi:hypothetical protein